MTLFLKIFLWFWLAMALIFGAVTLVTWTLSTEPIVRQWQTIVGETMKVHAQTAAQIFDAEGTAGLDTFLKRLENSERINAVGLFRQNGEQIAGGKFQFETNSILNKALGGEETEFERNETSWLIGKKTNLKSNETVILITQWERPRVPENDFPTSREIGQILAVVLTAGLVCYALASYLTAPIAKLRRATQNLPKAICRRA